MKKKKLFKVFGICILVMFCTMALYAWKNNENYVKLKSISPIQGKELFQSLLSPFLASDSNNTYQADVFLFPTDNMGDPIEKMNMDFRRIGDTIYQRMGTIFYLSYPSMNFVIDTLNKYLIVSENIIYKDIDLLNNSLFTDKFLFDSASYQLMDSGYGKILVLSNHNYTAINKVICHFDSTTLKLRELDYVWKDGHITSENGIKSFTTKIRINNKALLKIDNQVYSLLCNRIVGNRLNVYEQEGYRIIK